MYKGSLIALEGIEGTGKSTLAKGLYRLLSQDHDVLLTREPGGSPVAERIREILKDQNNQIDPMSELLLMFASRSLHSQQTIIPTIKKGGIVISDRYLDASYAYQGGGREIAVEKIEKLDQWVCHNTQPDIVILLTCSAEVAMQRVSKRQDYLDRFEQEALNFFIRAQDAYQNSVMKRKKYLIIDAEQSAEQVLKQAYDFLKKVL